MSEISDRERAQWAAACAAATPGPWRLTWDSQELRLHPAGVWEPAIAEWGYAVSPWRPETYDEVDRRDADFMVIAREALPRLLAAWTTAERERDAARDEAATWKARALAMNARAAEAAFFDSLMNDPPPALAAPYRAEGDGAPRLPPFNEGSTL